MKWYVYVICIVLVFCGAFCGVLLYEEFTAESYINGSIDISNQFSQESFSYSSSSVVFYNDIYDDEDIYYFETDLLKVDDFNGLINSYQVIINDYVLIDTTIYAGSVNSILLMEFYNTSGILDCVASLNISIQFFSDKTTLLLTVVGNDDYSGFVQSRYFEQYFSDNGIRLQVLEIL